MQANKIDLVINGESIESNDDNKLLNDYQPKDRMILTAKISQNGVSGGGGNCASSSPESSSDDGSDDSHNVIDSPRLELEVALPSVVS